MASTLLRSSTLRGSALRRVLSAAARPAAPSAGEVLGARRAAPFRRFFSSGAMGEQHPRSLDDKVCKFDHMLKQVEEINQLVELDVAEMLEMYKEYQIADHSCFERLLTRCGMTKSKFRDDLIWRCQCSTVFVLSAGVGYFACYCGCLNI